LEEEGTDVRGKKGVSSEEEGRWMAMRRVNKKVESLDDSLPS